MSFSSDVKQELNKNSNLSNKQLVKFELAGYLISENTSIIKNKMFKFSTENDYNINRFSKLLSNLDINHNIEMIGKTFVITASIRKVENIISCFENKIYPLKKEENRIFSEEELKAIVRGTFLGSGSINNPDNKYHFEMILSNMENLEFIMDSLKKLNVNAKSFISGSKYFVYLKDGEEISKMLALIGANKAVLKFEEIRVQREMRAKVNRLVNCETANLNKTINASIEQIAAIEKLKENGKFNKLDDKLKEIANLRLENPNMSLIDLGKALKEPVGKSGVNYRLKKIMEIADEK